MDTGSEELCDDVLLEIFSRLDASSLKNAALVCKSWDRVIGSSLSTMNKFTLKIHHENKKLEDILSLTRRFQSVDVSLGAFTPFVPFNQWKLELLTNVSRRHGSHIRKLVFHDTNLQVNNSIAEFFSNMPKLEYLEFSGVLFGNLPKMRLKAINPKALIHLKTLKISTSCGSLIEFLTGVQVSHFQTGNCIFSQEIQYVVNFLNESKALETLRVENADKIFDEKFSKEFTFKLKKLETVCHTISDVEESFVNFLKKHAATLEELSFEQPITTAIFITVFNNLKGLKKLTVHYCDQGEIRQIWNQLKPLKNLKNLTFVRGCYEPPFVSRFLSFCPNLEVPNFEIYTDNPTELIQTLSRNNPKITYLSLFNWKLTDPSTVGRFRFLKTLQLFSMLDAENFIIFLVNTRSLETLSVQWVNDDVMTVEVLEFLRVQPNLKHLKVGGSLKTAKLIHDELMKNHQNLETLELTVKIFLSQSKRIFLNLSSASLSSDSVRKNASEFFTLFTTPETEKPQSKFCASLSVVGTLRKFFQPSTQ